VGDSFFRPFSVLISVGKFCVSTGHQVGELKISPTSLTSLFFLLR